MLTRFILIGIGIVLFLLVTPVIVLYARGFKYDFNNNKVVKTGTLVVKTEPTNAFVFLNDIKHSGDTPINIRFLIPGDYNVRIEKEGYQSWTKRLPIRSQFVTWVNEGREFISLFYDAAHFSRETKIDYASVAKNRQEIAYIANSELKVIRTNHHAYDFVDKITTTPKNLDLPLTWNKAIQIINLPKTDLVGITKIETSESATVAIISNNLYAISADGSKKLLDEAVLDFTLDGSAIWYAQKTQIRRINPSTGEDVVVTTIPPTAKTRLIRSNNQLFVILDSNIYIINDELERIYSPATFGFFDGTSNKLVYGNSNEILVYDSGTHRSEVILRSITPIKNVTINLETGYIMFVNDNKIKAIELDGRDHRNIYTILALKDDFLDFIVSSDGIWMYVINSKNIEEFKIR